MLYQERKKLGKMVRIGVVVSFWLLLSACASHQASKKGIGSQVGASSGQPENKMITSIAVNDQGTPVTVSIDGNQLLTYTEVNQPLPLGLVLYFPETALGISKKEYAAQSDVIASIKAVELIENGPSKVTISLKKDSPYQISRSGNGLVISFGQEESEQGTITAQESPEEVKQPLEEEPVASPAVETAAQEPPVTEGTAPDEISAAPAPVVDVATTPAVSAPLVETPVIVSPPAVDLSETAAISGINQFQEISAVSADDGVSILVRSNQPVKDYSAFTLQDPPRIVLDLKNVKSTFKKQQTIAVDSKWVKTVRHFAYPDKLRVVLDTSKEFLSSYTVEPAENGLLVMVTEPIGASVGNADIKVVTAEPEEPIILDEKNPEEKSAAGEPSDSDSGVAGSMEVTPPTAVPAATAVIPEAAAPPVVVEAESSAEPVAVPAKAALVNRVDFLSGEGGKSSIIIGTTRPVSYQLEKESDTKLILELMDTKILSYRQRPLITTRFESAVNRIIPVQTAAMGSLSRVVIELREAVPYTIEQNTNEIEVMFEKSAVPPKPLEEAGLPPWEKVMKEAALAAETKVAEAGVAEAAPAGEMPSEVSDEAAPAMPTELPAETPVIEEPQPAVAGVESESAKEVEAAVSQSGVEKAVSLPEEEVLPELVEEKKAEKSETEEMAGPRKKYTGEKIALDFYQTDIKNVLRILRDVSGKNFAIDKDVKGSVTLTLVKPIPWDQVLDLILKMNQLGKISEGDIVRIVTISTLRKEEKIREDELKAAQAINQQKKALEPLVTEYIPINYADANKDIKPRLDQIKTPKRGKIGVDSRNNQIIMTDTADKIVQAKEIIRSIDKVTPQVVIEARIVEVSENFSRDIGTEWGLSGGPLTRNNDSHSYTLAMNHPPSSSTGSIGYQFARLSGTNVSLNAELQAVEAAGEGKIISTPKIVTLDNKQAVISQGIEYPYLERDSSGLSTTKFKNIDLELKVKPHVTPDNRINLTMDIKKDDIGTITGGVPSLNTNKAKTELLVNDGDTIVIGGILKTNAAETETRFPLLSKIPIMGWFFKSKNVSKTKNELLIFITPKIVHLESSL